jgi:hypothetical protein
MLKQPVTSSENPKKQGTFINLIFVLFSNIHGQKWKHLLLSGFASTQIFPHDENILRERGCELDSSGSGQGP